MRYRRTVVVVLAASLFAAGAAWAQREWRVYRSYEQHADYSPLPAGYEREFERPVGFVIGRLMYPSGWGFGRSRGGDWRSGGTSWAVDYPKGDRYYASILKRLTTIDVRAVEQPVNLVDEIDPDDVFNWPYLMVGLPGFWDLDDEMVRKLREYLLRGGFLFCDSFFGQDMWEGFEAGMKRVFPDREIIDLPDEHPLFHTVYNLTERQQIPNMNSLLGGGGGYLRFDGGIPRWRAIVDDHGRVMVAIAFNNDVSDSFQWADDPDYPAEAASLGLKLGVNFAVYALTH